MSVTIEGGIFMSKEKVIEIKINDVTYIVSEVYRNEDYLKPIIKDIHIISMAIFNKETFAFLFGL